ncbi:Bifunctional hemolysin/adenylate cyclase [Ensifer psoraleae]|uniref:calcium-binding protein n=1 Tax=Sinorhizobium psoraleae TaxID=520838 RepID=UPI0015684C6A|nr:calcium-binding protein [Sinorhizobium psoraleae]NRP73969.1 Bifunctional hemolysin/adenylate cyclase [Sinorhizobium psoraleae]
MGVTITVNSGYGLDMRGIDFEGVLYADAYSYSSTVFVAYYGSDGAEEFRGSGFVYYYGVPVSGTVKSYGVFYNGIPVLYMDGASISVASIVDAAYSTDTTSDDIAVIRAALAGNDVLKGGGLADYLQGFAGSDALYGNAGYDTLVGDDGNDTLIGGTGGDKLYGGTGTDTASYAGASLGVVANLTTAAANTNDARGDAYSSIENLTGSSYNDVLTGNVGANTLDGGLGNDTLIGGAGADRLYGRGGTDTVSYAGATAGVVANLTSAAANTNDARGDIYSEVESLIGTSYADKLYGNAVANGLTGGTGNDLLAGYAGNDLLYGGAGRDLLYGGTGADRFVFKATSESAGTSYDSIYDFLTSEQDRIDLSAIDASTKLTGNQTFSFVGTAAFKGVAGELRYEKHLSDTYIYADVNGDKVADLKIHLDDAVTLTKDYFIL